MMPRGVREYLASCDIAAVCFYQTGRVGFTRNPPSDAATWWCAASDAGRLVREARKTGGDIPGAACELGIELTPHAVVLARCAAAVKR
jgi:hypothetical protein